MLIKLGCEEGRKGRSVEFEFARSLLTNCNFAIADAMAECSAQYAYESSGTWFYEHGIYLQKLNGMGIRAQMIRY
jgi:hypothetical protein